MRSPATPNDSSRLRRLHNSEHVRFYVELNPRFAEGDSLLTWIPLDECNNSRLVAPPAAGEVGSMSALGSEPQRERFRPAHGDSRMSAYRDSRSARGIPDKFTAERTSTIKVAAKAGRRQPDRAPGATRPSL